MKTFSSICDLFIKEMGYNKLECHTDMEAKEIAAHQTLADKDYPVYYFKSDTTGEKGYEEFFIEGETRDMERFSSLGVILPKSNRSKQEVNEFLQKLEGTFMDKNFTKAQVVSCLKEFLPNFEHTEMGKNLDQKM